MLEGDGQPWWVETSGERSRERWEAQDWFIVSVRNAPL